METQNSLFNEQKSEHKQHNAFELVLNIDGASRGNPGPSGAGIVLQGKNILIKKCAFLGEKTNNQAEYLALALGLFYVHATLKKLGLTQVQLTIISDSLLLIQQMKGIYKIKDTKLRAIKSLIDESLHVTGAVFRHVLRAENTAADEQANKAIDNKVALPAAFLKLLETHSLVL